MTLPAMSPKPRGPSLHTQMQRAKAGMRDAEFFRLLRTAGLPKPECEFHFAVSMGRKWRFDYCWPAGMLAMEVQGAIFTHGRHTRGAALRKEHEKLNAAAVLGWRILYCEPKDLPTWETVATIYAALSPLRPPEGSEP